MKVGWRVDAILSFRRCISGLTLFRYRVCIQLLQVRSNKLFIVGSFSWSASITANPYEDFANNERGSGPHRTDTRAAAAGNKEMQPAFGSQMLQIVVVSGKVARHGPSAQAATAQSRSCCHREPQPK